MENTLYKSILMHSPVGYTYNKIIYDNNGIPKDYQILEVNKAYETMISFKAKDLIGKKISEIYESTKEIEFNWDSFHSSIYKDYINKDFEYCFDFLNKYFKVKVHIFNKDYIAIYLIDISLEMNQTDKLNMLSDNVISQVWYLSDPETYISANTAHAEFLGLEKEDFESKNINNLFSKEYAKNFINLNKKVFKYKKKTQHQSWFYNSKKEKRLLKITKNPKINPKGEIDFVVCSGEDITEKHLIEKENKRKEKILYASMNFTKELLANDDPYEALKNGIKMIGNATQVDRVYYAENHYDEVSQKILINQKFEWSLDNPDLITNNIKIQNLPLEKSGEFIKTLSKNKIFNSHIKDMDIKDKILKENLKSQDIFSTLTIPVFIKDEFKGFIGFDSYNFEREWSHIEISLLNSFTFLYIKALEKSLLQDEILQKNDNFYNFFNMIHDLFFVLDCNGNIIDANNNVLKKFNYTRDEILGKNIYMLIPESEVEKTKKQMSSFGNDKISLSNLPVISKDGEIFSLEIRVSKGLWNGEPVFFSVAKDISPLIRSEEKFSKSFNLSGVSMFISKFEDGRILDVNDAFLDYIGYKRNEILGIKTSNLKAIQGFDSRDKIVNKIKLHGKISGMEVDFLTKDNRPLTALINMVPLTLDKEKCLLTSLVDITEHVVYKEKILNLLNFDSLTGAYTRRYVYDSSEKIIAEYKRNKNNFSVAIIDLDDFKSVNDNFGHLAGDYILEEFTKILQGNLRSYDILGRYGGEEFIVVLNHSNKKDSYVVLNRILNIIRNKIFVFNDNKIQLTFSAGIASCEDLDKDDLTIDNLVEIADQRMHMAKQNGKNKIA